MKQLSFHNLAESYCRTNQCYGVYIAGYQFWNGEDYVPEFDVLRERVFWKYPEPQRFDVMSAILHDELMTFETEEEAKSLFNIMNATEFYSFFYACFFDPEGFSTENT